MYKKYLLPRETIDERPTIKRMLAILEPSALAVTISVAPLKTAKSDVINSGKEVPRATTVTPIIKGETLKANPISSALSTNQSADFIKNAKLKIKTTIQKINMFLF